MICVPLLKADGTPMTGRRLRIAQEANAFLNMIGFPRLPREGETMRTITQSDLDERLRHMEEVRAWVTAAIVDGWTFEPTYKSEPAGRAVTLDKGDWKAMAVTREPLEGANRYPDASLIVWGPGEISVRHTFPYDWDKLVENLQVCSFCKKTFVGEPYRVMFADRACQTCGSVEQGKLPHNWAD